MRLGSRERRPGVRAGEPVRTAEQVGWPVCNAHACLGEEQGYILAAGSYGLLRSISVVCFLPIGIFSEYENSQYACRNGMLAAQNRERV